MSINITSNKSPIILPVLYYNQLVLGADIGDHRMHIIDIENGICNECTKFKTGVYI